MACPPEKSPQLDYATPAQQKPARTVLAVVFGAIAGAVGLGAMYLGVTGILWLVDDWEKADGQDVFAVVMFNLIGAICLYFAVRWIWPDDAS